MRGSNIVISENPRGRFGEGTIEGTPLPGTIMQFKAATSVDDNGRHTITAFNRDADGNRPAGPLLVLLPRGEGYTYETAYTAGDRGFYYVPLPGDEMNLLWAEAGTGTGDAVAVGDLAIVEDGTGFIIDTTGSVESEPFAAMEALSDVVAAGTLTWVVHTGY